MQYFSSSLIGWDAGMLGSLEAIRLISLKII